MSETPPYPEETEECDDCGGTMDPFGPPLSGPWHWLCRSCGARKPTGWETPEDRIERKLSDDSGPKQTKLVTDGGTVEEDSEPVWPDGLEMGDRVEFDGDEYEVVGTGPGEATIERVDDDSYTAKVFRWAFTNAVGIELKTDVSQDEFGEMVTDPSTTETDRSGGGARE